MAETIVISYRDIIKNQPTVNIGTIGSVSHGKSSLVRSITNIRTQKHSKEVEKNLTINIGYANAKVFRCPETGYVCATNTTTNEMINPNTGKPMELIKHISFVDCPGHESYMSTMITGTTVMDAAMLVIAGNDKIIPEPQTYEHLLAISNTDVANILVLQNKLDLVTQEECMINLNKINEFLKGSIAEKSLIIPTSVQNGINIQAILRYIIDDIPDPIHDYEKPAQMIIIRSFDINKPGEEIDVLQGGVVGGSLRQGIFHLDDYIEIRPGIITRTENGFKCRPLISKIKSLQSDTQKLNLAVPGGLIGVCTMIDPMFTRENKMTGHVIGHIGTLPGVYDKIIVSYRYFPREKISKVKENENAILCINGMTIECTVTNIEKNEIENNITRIVTLKLSMPVCITINLSKVAIFRKTKSSNWKLSCYGTVTGGDEVELELTPEYHTKLNEFKPKNTKIIYERIYTPNKYVYDYNVLLQNIKFKTDDKFIMKIDSAKVDAMNKKTVINNFEYLYTTIDMSPIDNDQKIDIRTHLYNYILSELNTTGSINARNQMLIDGRFRQEGIQKVIKNYLMTYIICKNCKVPKVYLIKRNKLIIQCCNNCKAETTINE